MKLAHRVLLFFLASVYAFILAISMTMFSVGVGEAAASSFLFSGFISFLLGFPFWLPAIFPNTYLRRVCGVLLLFPCYLGITVLFVQIPKWVKGYELVSVLALINGIALTLVSVVAVYVLFFAHSNRHAE